MSHTILIMLDGPMQSWGSRSRFDDRDTHAEPTKSAVIGMVCAALGRPREVPIDDLASLRFGVRIEASGRAMSDFHTAQDVARAGGGLTNVTSRRHYLAEARFLAGLEGADIVFLAEIERGLKDPVWPLSLGRRSFPLTLPPYLPGGSVRPETDLETALTKEPWRRISHRESKPDKLRIVIQDPAGETVAADQPGNFEARQFSLRRLTSKLVDCPEEDPKWFISPS